MDPSELLSLPERLRNRIRIADDGCWLWTGSTDKHGYGQAQYFREDGGGTSTAHRVVWFYATGERLYGHEIWLDHLCHTIACRLGDACPHRRCVNPGHLEKTTPRENTMRGNTIAARNAGKTHCKHGHELAGDNLYIQHRAGRIARLCKTCMVASRRNFYLRSRSA